MVVQLAGCVIVRENKILLLHRASRDWYELPGGKIEEGETPEQAAKRELKEETGCDVEVGAFIGEQRFDYEGRAFLYYCFAGVMKTDKVVLGEAVHDHFVFMPLKVLKNAKLSPNVRMLIKNYPNISV